LLCSGAIWRGRLTELYRIVTIHVRGPKDGWTGSAGDTHVRSIFLMDKSFGKQAFRKMLYRSFVCNSMIVRSGCSLAAAAALHLICLRALLPLDDVELDVIALFEGFVAIELNRAVVHEDVRPIIPADETVALRIVEPLHLAFVLGHVSVTSLQSRFERWRVR
jgi:hypothetical protein